MRKYTHQGHMDKDGENKNPIFKSEWDNGMKIEVCQYYKDPDGDYKYDRIHLLITPADEEAGGWIMTMEEAIDIIYGLSKACSYEGELRYKESQPQETEANGDDRR